MLKIYGRLLLGSSFAALAAPSFAVCSIDDGNTAKGAGKPLVDCWIYPEGGGEGKVVKIEEGADAPEGYAFQPAPPKSDAEVLDEEGIEATQLEQANARIAELEGKVEELTKDNTAQAEVIGKADAKIESLEAEKSSLSESAQSLQDINGTLNEKVESLQSEIEELKNAAKAAKTATKKPAAKTAKTLKEPDTDKGGDKAGDTDAGDGDGQQ